MHAVLSCLEDLLRRFWWHVGRNGYWRFLTLCLLLLLCGYSSELLSDPNVDSGVTDSIHPAVWAVGGGAGFALLSALVRWALKNVGAIAVDRSNQGSEVAIHKGYRALLEDVQREMGRLHQEMDDLRAKYNSCEQRHEDRDIKDRTRDAEIADLKFKLERAGIA